MMFKKLFDPNQTVRHVSYREAKRRHEREMRLSDLIFKILAFATLVAFVVITVIGLMAQ